jgi:hypothetical protein
MPTIVRGLPSRVISSSSFASLGFGSGFEAGEARIPHLVQEIAQLSQSLRARTVEPPHAIAALVDEPGILEHFDVL